MRNSIHFLSLVLLIAIHAVQAASSGSLRQPLRKGQHRHQTTTSSRVPKATDNSATSSTQSQVKCLDGSPYLGPNHPCSLPIQSKLAYASGFNYSQYLRVQLQPKFHLEGIAELVDERVDPIINPGVNKVSGHTHTVFGGSNFASDLTYEKAREAECTSISVQADKSSYWIPTVYAQTDNGFQRIPIAQRFYYIMHHWVIDAPAEFKPFEETIHPFPKGFRQMIGDPARKTPLRSIQPHIFWCTPKNGATFSSYTFPNGCEGIKMTSMMPPCWDGKNLWLKNSAHTAWAVNFQNEPQLEGGFCPETHPVRLPSILFESNLDLSPFDGSYKLIFANGDTTGYGNHADFFNGWDIPTLQAGIAEVYMKGATPSQSRYADTSSSDIKAFKNPTRSLLGLLNLSKSCKFPKDKVVAPGIANPFDLKTPQVLKTLPGCNKPWASGPKPTC